MGCVEPGWGWWDLGGWLQWSADVFALICPLSAYLGTEDLQKWAIPHLGKQYAENDIRYMINNHTSVIAILIYIDSEYIVGKQEAGGQV